MSSSNGYTQGVGGLSSGTPSNVFTSGQPVGWNALPSRQSPLSADVSDDADWALLQAALDKGGRVVFEENATYQLNRTLTIKSDTELFIPASTTIRAVVGGLGTTDTFTLIQNENANSTPVQVTGSSAQAYSNMLVLVTFSFSGAHGITSPYVQLKGDGRDVYNGIWPIFSSTSSTISILMSIAGGSTNMPPAVATAVASASQSGVNFTTAANTFVAGQPVVLSGVVPTNFTAGRTYYVISAGLTTTNVRLAASPFAATGISCGSSGACVVSPVVQASAADGNITICGGGLLDGNYANGGFAFTNTTKDHGIVLRRVRSPLVKDLRFRDIRKYCIMGQDIWHPKVQNVDAVTGSDGVHFYGPCWNPLVENMTGTYGDDVAVFQNIDGAIYLGFMLGTGFDRGGDFFNGTMRNIRPRHTHNTAACTLYPQGNSGDTGATDAIYRVRGQIEVDGVSVQDPSLLNGANWKGWYAVGVGNGYVPVAAPFDRLLLKNIYGPCRLNNNGGGTSMTIDKVTIENAGGDSVFGDTSAIVLDYITVKSFTLANVSHTPGDGGGLVTIQSSNVSIDVLTFSQPTLGNANASGSVYGLQVIGSPTVGTISFFNATLLANGQFLGPASFAAAPTINIIGGAGKGYKCGIEKSDNTQSLNINISDFTSLNPTIGMFNFYGSDSGKTAAVKMRVKGLSFAGILFANQTGANYSVFNPDGSMPVDITKLARTVAQVAAHNGATAAGTIVANNLCVCDNTATTNSWKQMSDLTKTY